MRPDVPGYQVGMSLHHGTDVSNPTVRRTGWLKRETRESAALILVTLAVVLTVSFIGMAIA
jgi:hypothetical protein